MKKYFRYGHLLSRDHYVRIKFLKEMLERLYTFAIKLERETLHLITTSSKTLC